MLTLTGKFDQALKGTRQLTNSEIQDISTQRGLAIQYAATLLRARFKPAEAVIACEAQDTAYYLNAVIQPHSPAEYVEVCNDLLDINPDLWFTFGDFNMQFLDLDFVFNRGVLITITNPDLFLIVNGKEIMTSLTQLQDLVPVYPVLQEKLDRYGQKHRDQVLMAGIDAVPTL